jgi:hypothetical protein
MDGISWHFPFYPFSYLWSTSDIVLTIASIFLPFFLAWLTQWKLVKPLSEEKVPSQKSFHLLSVMGLSFVIFMEVYAVIIMPWVDSTSRLPSLSPEWLLSTISCVNLYFSSSIMGTLCVAMAEYKSKRTWNFSHMGVTQSKFDNALCWSEYSMLYLILSILSASAVLILQGIFFKPSVHNISDILRYPFGDFNNYSQNIALWTLFFLTLLLLASLTCKKLVKPLKKLWNSKEHLKVVCFLLWEDRKRNLQVYQLIHEYHQVALTLNPLTCHEVGA